MLYHIVEAQLWHSGYQPASLAAEGFVHLSTREQLPETLSRHFSHAQKLVLVQLDEQRIQDDLRWEPVLGRATPMPHLYRAIDEQDVVVVHELSRDQDEWSLP